MMNLMSVFFFVLSFITLLFGVLGRLAERPILGITPRALLDFTRTCLLFSIAARLFVR
ncbi:MAG TPA: hypothetical protein VFF86_06745 [Candidatus Methylomirabilis sp.]|nr:hypothetical protein [Candidatus Methylomirabilis sp.]